MRSEASTPDGRRAKFSTLDSSVPTAVVSGSRPETSRQQPEAPTQSGAKHSAPLDVSIAIGDWIGGRYQVLDILGEGGMGIVYRCLDAVSRESVAVKRVLVPEGATASDYLSWFYKEARALAALDHPGIVRARDFGELVGGHPYLVMDLAHGSSLHDLSQFQLPYPIIWSLTDQILDALAHAHARQVIHGDLKPSNVLVAAQASGPPRARLLDLGLAWLKEDPHDERLDGTKAMKFLPHAGAGTPGFMAPEQIKHELHHVCGATDMYALGCLLFRLLSGGPVFSGDPQELLRLHAYEQPPRLPVESLPSDAPREVVDFVARLLEVRPWDRYDFAAEARARWAELAPLTSLTPWRWQLPEPATRPAAASERVSEAPRAPINFPARTSGGGGLLSIRPPPLVGREGIRKRMLDRAEAIASGSGPRHQLILLLGPAGVGKSRLAEWLASTVHERGLMVPLTARYRRVRGSSSGMLGAVTNHFNFELCDRATIERSLMERWGARPTDRELCAWVAGAAEWLRPSDPEGARPLGPTGVRFTIDSLGVRRQIIRFTVRQIARGRPMLYVMDDLHNASETVIEGLLRIPERDADQPVLVVATVRTEDVQLGSPIAQQLRELRKRWNGDVIQVGPMEASETQALLQASLPLDQVAATEAAKRSRGFPLFALQQLHAWAQTGDLLLAEHGYEVSSKALSVRPKATSDLWEARVQVLAPAERESAEALATLGIDMRLVVVVALLEAMGKPSQSHIKALRKAEILIPRGPERYTWPHALLQEHLLLRLRSRADAEEVFIAAAEALRQHPLSNTRRVVRQRVMNLLQAGRNQQAATVLLEFLEVAWNGALLPHAALSDLKLFEGRLTGLYQARVLRWKAESLRLSGSAQEAKEQAELALATLAALSDEEAGSDQSSSVVPHERAQCTRILGQLEAILGAPERGLALVQAAAIAFRELGNVAGLAACEAARSGIAYHFGDFALAAEAAQRGAEHYSNVDRPLEHGQCLLLLAWLAHSEGRSARARRLARAAREHFETAGFRPGLGETTLLVAHVEHRLSNFRSAADGAREALSLFESLNVPHGIAKASRLLSIIAIDTDDVASAEGHARRALELSEGLDDPSRAAESQLLLAQVDLCRFQPHLAVERLELVAPCTAQDARLRQHYELTRAWLLLEQGDANAALRGLSAARRAFAQPSQTGQHTAQLLARLSRHRWPQPQAASVIQLWRRTIDDPELQDSDDDEPN